jgi:hypothetical protein
MILSESLWRESETVAELGYRLRRMDWGLDDPTENSLMRLSEHV